MLANLTLLASAPLGEGRSANRRGVAEQRGYKINLKKEDILC